MQKLVQIGLIGMLSVSMVGCAVESGRSEQMSTIAGGALGSVLGHQFGSGKGRAAATIAGALIGGYLAGNAGRTMDDVNRMKVAKALETTRTNHTKSWIDPDSQAEYAVTPTRTYHKHKMPCREFTTSILMDGRLQTAKGVACRDRNGNWRIVE